MQNFLHVWLVMAPVAVAVLAGYLWGRAGQRFDKETISDLIIYIASPCLVFSVISQKKVLWEEYLTVALAAAVVILGVGLLTYIFLALIGQTKLRGFYLPTMLMNTANMGFPITLFAYGENGLVRAMVFDLVLVFIMFSLGLALLGGRKDLFAGFKIPVLYAAAIAIVIATYQIHVPLTLLRATTILGQLAIPLMLLFLGYQLSSAHASLKWLPLCGALLRSLGGLMLGYLFVSFFPVSPINRQVILLYSALPSAMMSTVLTQKFKRDETLVAATVAVSTFAGLIFIPLLLFFI